MDIEMPVTNAESIPSKRVTTISLIQIRTRFFSLLWRASQCVALLALAAASYFVISRFVLQSVRVVGMSMSPTLHDSEHYLLNRWVFKVRAPHRADIVVIRDPADSGFSVKRIVA